MGKNFPWLMILLLQGSPVFYTSRDIPGNNFMAALIHFENAAGYFIIRYNSRTEGKKLFVFL
jgi:hypothetical protein